MSATATAPDEDLRCLTTRQLHELTGISESTLRQWRANDRPPASFKAGPNLVLYRFTVVKAWLDEREAAEQERRAS